jgi:ribosomal-protein-alanine N-acetyltransferase
MRKEDLSQVAEIDREAFPTQWPPPNYRHELELPLAHYLVSIDGNSTYAETTRPENGLNRLISPLKRLFQHERFTSSGSLPCARQYIVGFAGMWVMADEAHITNIAIRKQYQRRRIGELLLISLLDLANHMNASFMTLEVRASNTTAQNLYAKYGFKQVGTRRGYYLDNKEDGIIMSTESITSTSFQEHFQRLKQDCLKGASRAGL